MDFDNLHQILRSLYEEMTPLCSDMAGVAKGIAGLGALFYVASRVWQSLARTDPIDVYPLLRPFAIGLCIMFFPSFVLGTINVVLSPVVKGTHQMLESQSFDMEKYRDLKEELEIEAMKRNPETAFLVSDEEFDKQLDELGWSPSDLATMSGMYIETSFRQIRFFGIVFVILCAGITGYSVFSAFQFAEKQRQKIYVLDKGKSLILALSQDLSQNRPVEAREHIR